MRFLRPAPAWSAMRLVVSYGTILLCGTIFARILV